VFRGAYACGAIQNGIPYFAPAVCTDILLLSGHIASLPCVDRWSDSIASGVCVVKIEYDSKAASAFYPFFLNFWRGGKTG